MREVTLKSDTTTTLTYSIISTGQGQNFEQEGFEPEIEISDIHILGRRVNDDKFSELLTANEGVWVFEILDSLKRGKNGQF